MPDYTVTEVYPRGEFHPTVFRLGFDTTIDRARRRHRSGLFPDRLPRGLSITLWITVWHADFHNSPLWVLADRGFFFHWKYPLPSQAKRSIRASAKLVSKLAVMEGQKVCFACRQNQPSIRLPLWALTTGSLPKKDLSSSHGDFSVSRRLSSVDQVS